MPVRKEFRRFYASLEWKAIRARILARANGVCERCGRPDRRQVYATWDGTARWWPRGCRPADAGAELHLVRTVLTCAHLNHDPHDNRDENLQALCQGCHLRHDQRLHQNTARRTRAAKAGQRWLNDEIEHSAYPWAPPEGVA